MNKDIIASMIFAVGCFLFFAINVPQYKAIADVISVIKEREDLLAQRTREQENVEALVAQYQSRQSDIDKTGILLPEIKQIDQIISSIETISRESGLQIEGLTIGGSSDPGTVPYKTTFIGIDLGGTYSSLTNFLTETEKSLRLYDISEIGISRDTATGGGNLNFNIKISAYNLK